MSDKNNASRRAVLRSVAGVTAIGGLSGISTAQSNDAEVTVRFSNLSTAAQNLFETVLESGSASRGARNYPKELFTADRVKYGGVAYQLNLSRENSTRRSLGSEEINEKPPIGYKTVSGSELSQKSRGILVRSVKSRTRYMPNSEYPDDLRGIRYVRVGESLYELNPAVSNHTEFTLEAKEI